MDHDSDFITILQLAGIMCIDLTVPWKCQSLIPLAMFTKNKQLFTYNRSWIYAQEICFSISSDFEMKASSVKVYLKADMSCSA